MAYSSTEPPPTSSWQQQLTRKARLVHHQIAALQQLFSARAQGEAFLEEACAPYYALLEQIYTKDLPLAQAMDTSDLLLHLDGPGVQETNPKLSLVAGVLGDVRKQVGHVVKVVAGAIDEALALPKEIDFGLASFAKGSLYLGFTLPQVVPGTIDPNASALDRACSEALQTLGVVTADLADANPMRAYEAVRAHVPDPRRRDALLSAVSHLAPSGRRGITTVGITGKRLPDTRWRRLSIETRATVRQWLAQPLVGKELLEVTGRVREIDLDVRRLELRELHDAHGKPLAESLGLPTSAGALLSLRCLYSSMFDEPAKNWLNARLHVKGLAEIYNGQPRLLQAQEVHIQE